MPSSRSGSAVKGGPTGPSEASREAAPVTAEERRLRTRNSGVRLLGERVGEVRGGVGGRQSDQVAAVSDVEVRHVGDGRWLAAGRDPEYVIEVRCRVSAEQQGPQPAGSERDPRRHWRWWSSRRRPCR
jgi:hypothetical protein